MHWRRSCYSQLDVVNYCSLCIECSYQCCWTQRKFVKCSIHNSYPSDIHPAGAQCGKGKTRSPLLAHPLLQEIAFVPFPHILFILCSLGLEIQPDHEPPAMLQAWGTGMNLRECSTAGEGWVYLVDHLTLSTEISGIYLRGSTGVEYPLFKSMSFQWWEEKKFPLHGEKGRTSSRFGPWTQDTILSTFPCEFCHFCSTKSGQKLPSTLPGGCDTHFKVHCRQYALYVQ